MSRYMELSMGIELENGRKSEHLLKFLANLYGKIQAGQVWNRPLMDKLLSLGLKQPQIDDCVFYYDDMILIVYVDHALFLGLSDG